MTESECQNAPDALNLWVNPFRPFFLTNIRLESFLLKYDKEKCGFAHILSLYNVNQWPALLPSRQDELLREFTHLGKRKRKRYSTRRDVWNLVLFWTVFQEFPTLYILQLQQGSLFIYGSLSCKSNSNYSGPNLPFYEFRPQIEEKRFSRSYDWRCMILWLWDKITRYYLQPICIN